MRTQLGLIVAAVTLAIAPSSLAAVEPWADPGLPVRDGVTLWLDASTLNRSRQAQGLPAAIAGGVIDHWPDASGPSRRVSQRIESARPVWIDLEHGRGVVRFDGKDDSLATIGPERSVAEFTLFVVAAPRSNLAAFTGIVAANAIGKNDYISGFNLDQGAAPTSRFEALNLEGFGFGGARDMMKDAYDFGTAHTIQVRADKASVSLSIDGRDPVRRERQPGPIRLDEITVGARFYSNEATPPRVQGSFDGDLAELILFDRPLSDAECLSVRSYLAKKHEGLDARLAKLGSSSGHPLKTVSDPPPVQMFAPGFSVASLPLTLPNLNNLRYRPDGKLMALAYNGDVYLLSDTDADGLEDHAELFWESKGSLRGPIGMALTPPGYKLGSGVFVPSKGKLSLIVDTDGDDRADKEIVVAKGWTELPVAVDALGVAVAKDGSVYFGLGTTDYSNAYLLDAEGKAHFDPKGERGTIVRVAPDFSKREVVARGIRFSVGLAFNARGDLFATDQEGATWLPNGNPFDELLHIQKDRYYGFPPRHPKHLPDVLDEPSLFDFTPQHQSTCGLTFDEPVKPGGPIFGPESWRGDAIIAGYSRDKLWRTSLVPTAVGYVARTTLLACLDKLTVDNAVAPDGSLVVALHSGGPDWGSGPQGMGSLVKIRYVDRDRAQPVLAWPESPREVRVAFDRPIEPENLAGLARKASIEKGRYVAAGDRFETLRPGYAVVAAQMVAPRFDVNVRSVAVSPDRRTLIIATEPDVDPIPHAITLPDPSRRPVKGLRQAPEMDLGYDLTGLKATWSDADGKAAWSGWLPHVDLDVCRHFLTGSASHDPLWPHLKTRGSLTIEALLDLRDLLRPAVQPGATLDAKLPAEQVTLHLVGSGRVKAGTLPRGAVGMSLLDGEPLALKIGEAPDLLKILIKLRTEDGREPRLSLSWSTQEDPFPRPFPLRRILVPWASRDASKSTETENTIPPEIAGGSWLRGREVFYGEAAKCAKCHAVAGKGGSIGPDLANLVQRDYPSVLRDIREPSFAIHPDHIGQAIALRDGRLLSGVVRTQGDSLIIGDTDGKTTTIGRGDVEAMAPSPVSTMPTGLLDALPPAQVRDLLTFLLTPELKPAPIHREGAPPPRTKAEVEALFKALPASDPKTWTPSLKVLLVDGAKDHGIDEHDYPLWMERWSALLPQAEGVAIRKARDWPKPDDLAWADVTVWYSANAGWTADRGKQLDDYLARGGGLVYLHWAINGREATDALAERIGLASRPGAAKYRHGRIDLVTTAGNRHPIIAGLSRVTFEDESYWDLTGDPGRIDVLATSREEGADRPMVWAREVGKGRVVGCILGHYSWTFDDPVFRAIALRSIAWTAHESADRLHVLIPIGARITDR